MEWERTFPKNAHRGTADPRGTENGSLVSKGELTQTAIVTARYVPVIDACTFLRPYFPPGKL